MVCRELYGRGLIGSLKASTWYQQLQEKQKAAAARMPAREGVRVQVLPLSGKPIGPFSSPCPHALIVVTSHVLHAHAGAAGGMPAVKVTVIRCPAVVQGYNSRVKSCCDPH